ncbi:MAG: hypothetical protein IME96_11860 [Proteobacteria bacterium]|nr:hypothetical protein [Pseudomonadota bacterium]
MPHVFTYTAVNQTAEYEPPMLSNYSSTATVYSFFKEHHDIPYLRWEDRVNLTLTKKG